MRSTTGHSEPYQTAGQWRNLALLPFPLLAATIVTLWVADARISWTLPLMYQLIHYGSGILGLLFIVFPAARSFMAGGQPGVLMLGCGVLMSQIGAIVMPLAAGQSLNQGFAAYNTSVLLSSLCHFTGAASISRFDIHLKRKSLWLAAAFTVCIAVMGLVIWSAFTGRMPVFFVDGRGGTHVRSLVVGAAVALFALTAGLLWRANRRSASPFLFWYALGLILLATGLAGSMAIAIKDSPLQWVTRSTQVLGIIYMCIAVLTLARKSGAAIIPLESVGDAWREDTFLAGLRSRTFSGWVFRYGMAIVAAAAAMALWKALTMWIGPGLPVYITFYPAVMVVALLAGLGPGIAATAIAGVMVEYWLLPPVGQFAIDSPVNRLGLIIFAGMGVFMSSVAELYRHNRLKVSTYERDLALRENEERIKALYLSMSEGLANHEIVYKDGIAVDYIITDVNPAFEKITGLNRSSALGKKATELYGTGTPPYLDVYARVAESGEPEHFETTFAPMQKSFAISVFSPGKGKFATVFSDITERKRLENDLRKNQVELQSLFNHSNAGLVLFDAKPPYTVLAHNKYYQELFAEPYKTRGMVGKNVYDYAPAVEAQGVVAVFDQVLQTKKPVDLLDFPYDSHPPEKSWFNWHLSPVIHDGEVVALASMSINVTEQHMAEQALRESEARFRGTLDSMLEGCQILDYEWRYVYINAAAERHNRRPNSELIGNRYMDMWPGIESTHVFAVIRQCLEERTAQTLENEFSFPDGTIGWFDLIVQPVPEGVFILSVDTTTRKRTEAALREAELQKQTASYTRNLIEASLDPLVTISAGGKITDVNEATVRATGVPREGLIGTDFSDYFTEPEKASRGYRQVFDRGAVTDYPLTILHKDGAVMDVLYNASVYRDNGGNVLGIFAAARDITARKRVEDELAVYRRSLEDLVAARTAELQAAVADLNGSRRAALNLLKDTMEARRAAEQAETSIRRAAEDLERSNKDLEQFAYVASHDLQEPLRAVGGFMGLLKKQYNENLDAGAREYIEQAIEGAERMQALINDLLTFSRVGTRGAAFAVINMKEAADRALKNLQAAIAESTTIVTCGSMPEVSADLSQMTQLIQNLIGNAIKFHGPRRPEVHLTAQRKDDCWVFSVADNGIGIEPQYFDRIFLIFQRLHTRSQYKGTGIGLAICKKIVERHGGKLWVESRVDVGSTFYFTLPERGNTV
jgi:PAS domain S-box-containing protein